MLLATRHLRGYIILQVTIHGPITLTEGEADTGTGLSEGEESSPPLTSRQVHPLHLLLQCFQLHPCTRLHCSPTPLRTPLDQALSPLLSVTSPSLCMRLDHQFSTLLGLLLVPSPLLCLFHPPSLSPPSLKKISTDSGTTDRTKLHLNWMNLQRTSTKSL